MNDMSRVRQAVILAGAFQLAQLVQLAQAPRKLPVENFSQNLILLTPVFSK